MLRDLLQAIYQAAGVVVMESEKDKSEKQDRIKEETMKQECVREFLAWLDKQGIEKFWRDVMEAHHED